MPRKAKAHPVPAGDSPHGLKVAVVLTFQLVSGQQENQNF
jgi:hypothetical protein